ncbi:MAG: hypothetical protein NVS4B10_09280 [Myxococcales bacterium]
MLGYIAAPPTILVSDEDFADMDEAASLLPPMLAQAPRSEAKATAVKDLFMKFSVVEMRQEQLSRGELRVRLRAGFEPRHVVEMGRP